MKLAVLVLCSIAIINNKTILSVKFFIDFMICRTLASKIYIKGLCNSSQHYYTQIKCERSLESVYS